jgi:hypothetical protein
MFSTIQNRDSYPLTSCTISSAAPASLILHSPDDKRILLYSVNGGFIRDTPESHGQIISPIIAKDLYRQDTFIYGTKYGEVFIRDAMTLETKKRVIITKNIPVTSVLVSRDHRFLLVGCSTGDLFVVTDPSSVLCLIEKQWGISSALKLV